MAHKNGIALTGILAALLAAACDLPHEPGPQPATIIETPFKPGLNILGILRLDDQPGSSFFYIERAYRYQEMDTLDFDESFIPIVDNAMVLVQGTVDTTTYVFTHDELDSLRGEIYANHHFTPVAGEQYTLTITHTELDTLTGTTVVPVPPSIDSLVVMGQLVAFQLLATADTYLYDVCLMSPSDSLHYRFVNQDGEERLPVFFNTTASEGEPLTIHLYGYDANLADYLSSPITIKPQTYQETVTTVTGGYGVFGSVSVAKMRLTR